MGGTLGEWHRVFLRSAHIRKLIIPFHRCPLERSPCILILSLSLPPSLHLFDAIRRTLPRTLEGGSVGRRVWVVG